MAPRLARLAVATIVAAAALSPHVAAERAAACTAPPKTMTFQCDNTCGANIPCLANTTTVGGAASCSVKCLDNIYASEAQLNLYVRFGTWKSAQELAEPPSPSPTKAPVETDTYVIVNDDVLDEIEPLELPSKLTAVVISGGILYSPKIRGRVSNVKLSPKLLTNSTGIKTVALVNLNLQPQVDTIAGLLPSNVTSLTLDNGLFPEFPAGLDAFKKLVRMSFQRNYLTSVNSTFGMDALDTLNVTGNDIASFTAVFPKLRALDLTSNQLREVPPVLAQYSTLQDLRLGDNPLVKIPSSTALPASLTSLQLDGANLSSFEAFAPNLVMLNLTMNNLTAIPQAIFNLTKLTALYLSGNPISNNTITSAQASFLAGLGTFFMSNDNMNKDCAVGRLTTVRFHTFCIIDAGAGNKTSDSSSSSSSSSTGVIIGIVGGVVVLIAIVGAVLYTRRNNRRANEMTTSTMNLTNGTGGTRSLWTDPDLIAVKVNAGDIEDVKVLGKGAFGDVWLVKYRKTQLLASKRLRKSGISPTQTQNFIDEIKLVAKLEHPNIVAFIGAAWTIQSDLQALFEFMDGGDLRDYLTNSSTPRAWTPEKLQIAIDVAEALVYVHSFAPPLVHRDLKSRNVLLGSGGDGTSTGTGTAGTSDGTLRAKLTDFGVSRFRSEDNTMTSGVGTGKWLAPEVIAGSTDYGAPADIFSFGAVLTELDTHVLPYDEVRGPNGAKLADVALLQLIASGEVRPQFSSKCPAPLAELAERCFALDPAMRPVAAEIAYALRQLKKSLFTVL